MFRFTTKKVEVEKLKQLYDANNIKIPEKKYYGEEYLKQCFDTHEKSQQVERQPQNMNKKFKNKFDMTRAQSSDKNSRSKYKQNNSQIQNLGVHSIDLSNSYLDKRMNSKKQKAIGTYIFPNQQKQKSYYIIPSSKAGLMDLFEKYKDYTPKEITAFKTATQKVTPQRPVRHYRALSYNLSQTINNSDKKQQSYYDYEIPQSNANLFENKKLNQSTSFFNQTFQVYDDNSNLYGNYNNNSFIDSSPQQDINNAFQVDVQNNSRMIQKDNIFSVTAYNKASETKYKQTHNSCFRGASREKVTAQSFFPTNNNPGPGEYENKSQFITKQQKIQAQTNEKIPQNENHKHSISKLKRRIEKAVNSENVKITPMQDNADKTLLNSLKPQNPSFMFVADQRDRFGENQYINFFSNKNPMYSPGPGQYQQIHNTIQSQYQRIEKIKDQRKLLKEWLSPKNTHKQEEDQQIQNIQEDYTSEPLCVYQFSYN